MTNTEVDLLESKNEMQSKRRNCKRILQQKHPAAREDAEFPAEPASENLASYVTADEVAAAILSVPNGPAGGLDGLRPQQLKDMIAAVDILSTRRLLNAPARLTTRSRRYCVRVSCLVRLCWRCENRTVVNALLP